MTPNLKRRLRIVAVLVCVLALSLPLAWRVAPSLLMVDTGLPGARATQPQTTNHETVGDQRTSGKGQSVGAIIVLGGEPWTRPQRAAEVFQELSRLRRPTEMGQGSGDLKPEGGSVSPLVIASGNGDCEDVRRQLEARGVPHDLIQTEGESKTTFENAKFSAAILRAHHVTNAVIVTSWYHSRRALACFEKAAPEITFYSCPTAQPASQSWWPDKYVRKRILQEYAKILYYWLFHGVPP